MPFTRPALSSSARTDIRDAAVHPDSIQAQWQRGIDERLAAARGPDWVHEPNRLDRMVLALRGGSR